MLNKKSRSSSFEAILSIEGVNAKGYGTIPRLAMLDNRLTIEAKGIYAYFCSHTNAGNVSMPNVSDIISDLNISKSRYYKHLKLLIDCGYLSTYQRKNETVFAKNTYVLH